MATTKRGNPHTKTEMLRVNTTPELKRAVVKEARARDVSEAHVVRDALRRYFNATK